MYDPSSIRILMGNMRGNFLLHDCIMGAHTLTAADEEKRTMEQHDRL